MSLNQSGNDSEFTEKYTSAKGVGAWLINNFFNNVNGLIGEVVQEQDKVLEVGCGAGFSTEKIKKHLPVNTEFTATDISGSLLEKAKQLNPSVAFTQQSVYALALPDKSMDVVIMLEVLEHLDNPEAALRELARVAKKYVILSTPREPIWCALNFLRGKYWASLGNTPGHIQHWSSRSLAKFCSSKFDIATIRKPLPWTVLLLKVKSS